MEGEENNNNNNNSDNHDDDAMIEKKQPLKIDFTALFGPGHDDEPPEQVVLSSDATAADHRRRTPEKRRKRPSNSSSASSAASSSSSGMEDLGRMPDHELKEKITRATGHIASIASRLPDKGAKLKASLQLFQEEWERRKLRRSQEDANGFKKPAHSGSSNLNGASDRLKQATPSSQLPKMSEFGTSFMKKLEDDTNSKQEQNAGDQASNAFDREISSLNCDKQKRKPVGPSPPRKRAKPGLSCKQFYTWQPNNCSRNSMKPSNRSRNVEKYMPLNLVGRASSTGSLPLSKEKLAGSLTEKDASQAMNSNGLKNEKTVVLVDEEESELVETKQEAEQPPSSTNESKIYYPSREDPESLEIFRSELKCLEPGECLTSTILNFYIRFLQELCSTDRSQHNFHFFNTYFYSKLQKAVRYQKSDKEAFFIKFRRWWRGVNIFQKAYIFLPINEDNHWSLVIICIPDKEDESGPVILHLDSLGLHCSRSIFNNIRSLLKIEWEYLKEGDDAHDIPMQERIWKMLPRRIEEKIISVPRQSNDYDCGLFVLYYMERFIQDAPDRLNRQDLTMFGKNWFKPQEASSLRGKIKKILQEEFHKALKEDNCVWQPVSLPSNAGTPKPMDCASNS